MLSALATLGAYRPTVLLLLLLLLSALATLGAHLPTRGEEGYVGTGDENGVEDECGDSTDNRFQQALDCAVEEHGEVPQGEELV
jgi:hypothetical protein